MREDAEIRRKERENDYDDDFFHTGTSPIIQIVDALITQAIEEGISDIHIEPFDKTVHIRYRVDGVMYRYSLLPLAIKDYVISRIKVIADMDITEKRLPLDGRIKFNYKDKKYVDIRVSTIPTLSGESVVLRILDKEFLNIDLDGIIDNKRVLEKVKINIKKPSGLILIVGPTGSGKTTTIYSMLKRLNKDSVKILTAENPVEFFFKGMNQVNINREIGLDFANVLRAFLRQDPDIMMVGEIRDLETAQIAIRAAMTGHLVFSTLHTHDSVATIFRLIDIGIPRYLLSGTINMILSQRLLRKLCPHCKIEHKNDKLFKDVGLEKKDIENVKIYKKSGCEKCHYLGYSGRVAIYELMQLNDNLREAINSNTSERVIREIAIKDGMQTLNIAGINKVKAGISSIEEVLRNSDFNIS